VQRELERDDPQHQFSYYNIIDAIYSALWGVDFKLTKRAEEVDFPSTAKPQAQSPTKPEPRAKAKASLESITPSAPVALVTRTAKRRKSAPPATGLCEVCLTNDEELKNTISHHITTPKKSAKGDHEGSFVCDPT